MLTTAIASAAVATHTDTASDASSQLRDDWSSFAVRISRSDDDFSIVSSTAPVRFDATAMSFSVSRKFAMTVVSSACAAPCCSSADVIRVSEDSTRSNRFSSAELADPIACVRRSDSALIVSDSSSGAFGGFVPDPRYYPPMEQALNNGNVAVYTVNTLGATRGGNSLVGITDSLSSISNDTGGHYYSNFINVNTPLEQVSEENRGYYLISYTTEYDAGESGYREVEVDVTVDKARVTARKGYRFGTPNQE